MPQKSIFSCSNDAGNLNSELNWLLTTKTFADWDNSTCLLLMNQCKFAGGKVLWHEQLMLTLSPMLKLGLSLGSPEMTGILSGRLMTVMWPLLATKRKGGASRVTWQAYRPVESREISWSAIWCRFPGGIIWKCLIGKSISWFSIYKLMANNNRYVHLETGQTFCKRYS